MIALVGIAVLVGIAILFSENRRGINPRVVIAAFGLQAAIAAFALYFPPGQEVLRVMSEGVQNIIDYAQAGIDFLWGDLATGKFGFVVALKVLPVIIFMSSLIAVLYHIRIMQLIILGIGGVLRKVIGAAQVESFCAAANIFVGMVESPLIVRPYLKSLTRSQLFAIMAVGLSSVAGAIMVGYASLGIDLHYLITASFMAAPGGLFMAKLLVPESPELHETEIKDLKITAFDPEHRPVNVIEAAADGAMVGLKIAVGVGAMLMAFVALLALLNGIVSGVGGWFDIENLTLEQILGYVFAPLMFLLGVPWDEAKSAGNLVGQKTILNEFIAYINFAPIKETFSERTQAIITFALCGFANLSALAIIIGGLGGMVPERKHEVAQLGLKAVLAGTLANLTSAALASVLLSL
ncbi:MAG: NupC/NupG family nucleoside CNT transporter [Sphingomonadales bacterium]|nr:NupC/NupG family nucleoside CNT transporter [Sphingomonadales bacterium]